MSVYYLLLITYENRIGKKNSEEFNTYNSVR